MSFYNGVLNHDDVHGPGQIGPRGLPGIGFNLDSNNDYDMQNKKLVNVKNGVNGSDAVTKSQLDTKTSLLDGARTHGYIVNNKAVIYSQSGAVHAKSFYLQDQNEDEVRILTDNQDFDNVHLFVPNLKNFDGFGGRKRSEIMVTSVDQTVSGNKFFQNIKARNPTEEGDVANKNYVDFEITKQNVLIDNEFVKKSGSLITGDLILPHYNYPVQGNTNKAISYETQREIFISRKETFPLETDINMNNNLIQNVATPTSSHQATNKGYCDYNFLNRQKGGVLTGPLSMNRNDIIGIPDTPKFGYSAVNKNYVDGEISKIDTTQFVKKVGDTMTGVLNMNGNKIKNVGTPYTYENDAVVNVGFFNTELNASNSNVFTQITNAYKQYVDHSHVSPSGQQTDVLRYLMEDADHSSSENNIVVTGIVDFAASPHEINKKAYEFTLVKDTDGSNDYRSRIGFNLYSLPLGYYTIIIEYMPPEMTNVIVTVQGTTINIASQTTKTFDNYTKTLIKFHNWRKSTPDYLFINLHGKTTSSTTGHLIVYGVKGYVSSVEPKIYDTVFSVNNGNMVMQTNIDLNNHKIINLANPTDDGDACNKRYVDIVDTKINDLSYYTKDHRYKNVFGEHFYDLIETSRFNLIQGVSGVVINGVLPNFVLETDRFITDYNPKYGLKLSTKTHIRTADVFNQNSSFTFFMSFMHDNTKTGEISFSNTLNLHIKFYPRYRITSNKLIIDYQAGTHETTFTSDFQNKQLFVWICFDGTQNLYKMALSNYSSHVSETFIPPSNFQSRQLEIDYETYVNKIGFADRFIDIDDLEFHRITLEEKRNGSYIE